MKRLALMFSGGGTQYVGMSKNFYERYPFVRDTFNEATRLVGYDITALCFEGKHDDADVTRKNLEAIFVVSFAMSQVYDKEIGLRPQYLLGHSLGEYTALVYADSLRFGDALKLISVRGELAQTESRRSIGGMMAVNKLTGDTIEQLCAEAVRAGMKVFVSVYNSRFQYVLSGSMSDLLTIRIRFEELGGNCQMLDTGFASHCALMDEACGQFNNVLRTIDFRQPKINVISNLTGSQYESASEVRNSLSLHLTKPVQWQRSVEGLEHKVDGFVEIGPQSVLKNLVEFILPRYPSFSLDDRHGVVSLKKYAGIPSNNLDGFLKECLRLAVCTKNNNPSADGHQEVVSCFRDLEALADITSVRSAADQSVLLGISRLTKILELKHIDQAEAKALINSAIKTYLPTSQSVLTI